MVKLEEATLTSQGQISIPKKIRLKLHLERGDRVIFLQDDNGRVYIEEVEAPLDFSHKDWELFLEKTKKEPVTKVTGKKAALEHLDKLMNRK